MSAARTETWRSALGGWVRDRSLGIFFLSAFGTAWIAQLFFEWQTYAADQREHGAHAVFWSAGFWNTFAQSTLENWQSEFLQIAVFTIAAAYFVFKGSSESPDSGERIEHKLDALMNRLGMDPSEVESELPRSIARPASERAAPENDERRPGGRLSSTHDAMYELRYEPFASRTCTRR